VAKAGLCVRDDIILIPYPFANKSLKRRLAEMRDIEIIFLMFGNQILINAAHTAGRECKCLQ
jgi:hypothetical protein